MDECLRYAGFVDAVPSDRSDDEVGTPDPQAGRGHDPCGTHLWSGLPPNEASLARDTPPQPTILDSSSFENVEDERPDQRLHHHHPRRTSHAALACYVAATAHGKRFFGMEIRLGVRFKGVDGVSGKDRVSLPRSSADSRTLRMRIAGRPAWTWLASPQSRRLSSIRTAPTIRLE